MNHEIRLMLSTVGSREDGLALGRALVKAGLAACVTLVPGCLSIYEWEGRLEEESECLLLLKTSSGRLAELMEELARRHPYDVPEMLVLDPSTAGREYLAWVLAQCDR